MIKEYSKLSELLTIVEQPSKLKVDAHVRDSIRHEHLHLMKMLHNGVRVYGMNTAVGHRDASMGFRQETVWKEIVESHLIGVGLPYSSFQARCIGFSKLMQWCNGQSGVSPELFDHVTRVISELDFFPNIPSGQSYSSGDVIPATHWAVAVLQGTHNIPSFTGAGEAMPLINGSFVHVGLAAASMPIFDKCYKVWLSSTEKILASICRNNSLIFSSEYKFQFALSNNFDYGKPPLLGPQDSVSIRASLDVAEVMRQNRENMELRLSSALSTPSSNPLIDKNFPFPISQASFLESSLVIAQSAFIESILLAMWVSVSRIQYILSGVLPGIPLDGGGSGLGMIQRPKKMLAILEHARLKAGRRVFASGGSASNGIEDLWTNGVFVSELIDDLCRMFEDCCEVEAGIIEEVL